MSILASESDEDVEVSLSSTRLASAANAVKEKTIVTEHHDQCAVAAAVGSAWEGLGGCHGLKTYRLDETTAYWQG